MKDRDQYRSINRHLTEVGSWGGHIGDVFRVVGLGLGV